MAIEECARLLPGPPVAGKEWLARSRLVRLGNAATFAEVRRRVCAHRGGSTPVVVLDLDSTLYNNGPRVVRIVHEWLAAPSTEVSEHVRVALSRVSGDAVPYGLADLFVAVGLDPSDSEIRVALEQLRGFWKQRFFTDAYVSADEPYPGAVQWVRELRALGANIVYLTGRDEPHMGRGTRAALERDGFPLGVGAALMMKPTFETDDAEFKAAALRRVRELGTVVATADNEPANVAVFVAAFPRATHVFFHTIASDKPARLVAGVYYVERFSSTDVEHCRAHKRRSAVVVHEEPDSR